ncbi:MAG: hypothetical protein IPM21_00685 [Acidobacteria bacterium]|nr:hypothetical protein [Acidobacteriota bacterium]
MSPIRRIYRRVTTTKRIRVEQATVDTPATSFSGETFTVEIYREEPTGQERIYSRQHTGKVEVEELLDGEFRLTGHR